MHGPAYTPSMRLRALALLLPDSMALLGAAAQAVPASAGPSVFGSGAPAFADYAAPSGLNNHDNAGEPSIGVDWNTGTVLYQADTSTYAVRFDDSTSPAASSWSDTGNPASAVNLDPILATDHTLGRTWAGGLATTCSLLAYTDHDGQPWTSTNPCTGTYDHETIGSGPWAGATPAGAWPHAVYYCAQGGGSGDACVTSTSGGASFGAPVFWSGACNSLHGHVKVSADGSAYVPDATCGGLVGGAVSRNDGGSWTSYTIPGTSATSRGFDPSVATTPDNTVYEAWARQGDWHPVVAHSTSHGASWSGIIDLAGTVSPPLVASTFQAVVAGSNGRVAVAYLGTSVGGGAPTPFDSGSTAVWYLYVSFSYDGGGSWTTVNATPGHPVQRGCISDGGTTSTGCRNLLDFIDASVTAPGRVVVAFADGCLDSCGSASQSTDAWASIARQSSGAGLFAPGTNPSPSGSGGGGGGGSGGSGPGGSGSGSSGSGGSGGGGGGGGPASGGGTAAAHSAGASASAAASPSGTGTASGSPGDGPAAPGDAATPAGRAPAAGAGGSSPLRFVLPAALLVALAGGGAAARRRHRRGEPPPAS